MRILEVQNCTICYQDDLPAVSAVSFSVEEGEIVSIVGESGSGKTTLIRAILGLLPSGGRVTSGRIMFGDVDLARASERTLQDIRGRQIAMIFQDAGASMDPIQRVGTQYCESIRAHGRTPLRRCREITAAMLRQVRLTDAERVMDAYPFELSGGMKQRVGIAMGMTSSPALLLADEPTSALDATIQAQVVQQMKLLRDNHGATIILVTHNMGVASYLSDKIGVMYRSRMVEFGPRDRIIFEPQAQYTRDLLAAVPKLGGERFAR